MSTDDIRWRVRSGRRPIRLGYVPLNDCAPVVIAHELGGFTRHGIEVELSRDLGWASLRDRLVRGDIDAAHAPCSLPLYLAVGHNCPPLDVVVGMTLSLHGNAITLSEKLWEAGVRDAASLHSYFQMKRGTDKLTFGIVSAYSTHRYLLERWMAGAGPGRDPSSQVQIVIVPPAQMPEHLAAGHLDGYCSGEPWNSVAVAGGIGWVAATSSELAPLHPEKVVVVREEFLRRAPDEFRRLIAALLEACHWCAQPGNAPDLAAQLALPRHLDLPKEIILRGLPGRFDYGHGRHAMLSDLVQFDGDGIHEPSPDQTAWMIRNLLPESVRTMWTSARLREIYRVDLYREARGLIKIMGA